MLYAVRTLLLLALAAAGAAPAFAQDDTPTPPDSVSPVESYWGPIAIDADSSRAVFHTRPARAWEQAVLTPYRVVTYPVFLATRGVKAGLVFADERKLLARIGFAFPVRVGPIAAAPVGTVGGLPGLGGGATIVAIRSREPADWIKLRYLATVNGTHRASTGLRLPWGRPGALEAGGGYRLQRNALFYGLGPESRESDRSYFTQEQHWAGASYRHGLVGPLTAEWSVVYSSIATRDPRPEDQPGVGAVFGSAVPGFGGRSAGVLHNALLRLDTSEETGRPAAGVIAEVMAGYFDGTDRRGAGFWRYSSEAGGFFPLWLTDRTLAVRAAGSWIDPTGGEPVPFTRLARNHSGGDLRGYGDFRWWDRGLLDLSAEYRWPVWAMKRSHDVGVDAYLFLNSGQVFGRFEDVAARLWRTSWGGGFRLIGHHGFAGRLEIARSAESTILRLRADQIFELTRSGLYAGHIPVSAPD